MKRILIVLLFLVAIAQCHYDWDWMDCHHGQYVSPQQVGDDHCDCDEGWTGVDCSLCGTSTVCGENEICDKSLIIDKYKSFNCTPTSKNGIIPPGSVDSQWDFSAGQGKGVGIVSVYIHPTGAPFLFNCTFSGCSSTVDQAADSMTVSCTDTSCFCSSWCNVIVSNIIKQMHTSAEFDCTLSTADCTIKQKELPLVIELNCEAAGCQEGQYVPPVQKFTTLSIVLIIVGSSATFIALVISFGYVTSVLRRKYRKAVRMYPGLHENLKVTLSWHNLGCEIKNKTVLNNISGIASPGHVTALLGPSGAGKTTFLDMLAGRKNVGKMSGKILINGVERDSSWKRISGYVMQDDRMLGTLTVREHLSYVARLRLPSYLTYEQKMARVDEVLEELSISHIADSIIGTTTSRGISGGEKRRLSIATELITDPPILFLDEPTSGLDAYTAYSLVQTLQKLAHDKDRTIVVSIHQPRSNIYYLFDSLMLLAYGEVIYYGTAKDSLPYFTSLNHNCPANYNPADYFIDLVQMNSKTVVQELASTYKSSEMAKSMDASLKHIIEVPSGLNITEEFSKEYASSFFLQIWLLCKRTLVNNLRNPYLMRVQYAVTIVLSLLIGGIFFKLSLDLVGVQDRAGALFFLIALTSFAAMSSIDTFFEERPLFLRERAVGMYRTSSYFISKTLCDVLPMRIIPALLLGGITYYMIGFNPPIENFLWFILTLIEVSIVAGAMCLLISSFVPSLSLGNLIAIILLLFYMLFGGFLVNKSSMPAALRWFSWVSFIEYGFEILMINELENAVIIFDPKGDTSVNVTVNGIVFLQQFDMNPDRFYVDFVALALMAVTYLMGAYLLLRFFVKEKR